MLTDETENKAYNIKCQRLQFLNSAISMCM